MRNKNYFLLAFMLVMMLANSLSAIAKTVSVVSNSDSGIENADLTVTLDDGTILGFTTYYSNSACFCGAISSQTELSVPDSIWYSSTRYAVEYIGYSRCDFDNAQSVTSLILPATVKDLNYLPEPIKVLHTNNYISYVNYNQLSNLDKVLVPEADLSSYYNNTNWSNYVLINAEGTDPFKVTINMTKAGEFAQLLLQKIDNWYKVNELTVVGELNTDDLNVFKRMRQLTKLDLSKAVITDIPNQFDGANSYSSRDGFNLLEELILPEVGKIGDYAFCACYRLKKTTMPKVESIGNYAFANCGASQITLPEGLLTIGDYAFYRSQLESITIPSSISEISRYCFQECSKLKTAVIPASVTKIGYCAFYKSGLTSIDLPGVKTIAGNAFYNCQQLTNVRIAEGLINFEDDPFSSCTALTEIDLPSTVRELYSNAFNSCTNIKKFICRAVVPPATTYGTIMNNCDMTDVKLYVPAMSIDKYRAENGWKGFYTILPLEDKTSYAYINNDATINDATEFTDNLDMTLDWIYQSNDGKYLCGALDYNGNSQLSMHNYKQYHYLGRSSWDNNYSYDAHFTSLISNGAMRADSVLTTLRTYDTYTWYFISLPYDVKVSDITYTNDAQFVIRKYSGLNRAHLSGDTWLNLTPDSVMHAYEGYILRCNKDKTDFMFPAINNANKNKVFEKESVVMPLGEYLSEFEHDRSWNLIGNPYPCFYDTRYMDFTAPITVWNRYNNSYDAYSPIDDAFILHPAQAFFVQRPVDKAAITFDKAGRQKDAVASEKPAQARMRASVKSDRQIFNIIMSDGEMTDRTRFVMNSDASLSYELDKDASKFIAGNNTAMLVYTVENGVRYAINERPMANGVVQLGFYAPVDGNFTITLNTAENEKVVLIDNETKEETILNGEYRFNASAGYNDARFSLSIGGEATGISEINTDIIPSDAPYSIYTVGGRLVGNYSAGDKMELPKGVYIISSKDVKHKIVVK